MTRQDFDKWKERSSEKYESEQLVGFEEWERMNSKIDFKEGADAAFNLLSKEISEKDYWKQRCEAAEAILKKYYRRIPDCAEIITWHELTNNQL